jgi:hypothetical protein
VIHAERPARKSRRKSRVRRSSVVEVLISHSLGTESTATPPALNTQRISSSAAAGSGRCSRTVGVVHAIGRVGRERQLNRVSWGERGVGPEAPAGASAQHVREAHAESPAGGHARQEGADAAADLTDAIARPRRQARPDAPHTLALDPADEHARVVAETTEVVLADHPRLDLGAVVECPGCHGHYAITGRACTAEIPPTDPGGLTGVGRAAAAVSIGDGP